MWYSWPEVNKKQMSSTKKLSRSTAHLLEAITHLYRTETGTGRMKNGHILDSGQRDNLLILVHTVWMP